MKVIDMRNLSEVEIKQKIQDIEKEMFNLRFQSRTGGVENPVKIRSLRRDVARLNTVLKQIEHEKKNITVKKAK